MIELSGVSYSYGERSLFSDVSLSLSPGSFHFLTGPSGTGKTTLLKLCNLELSPETGQIRAFGEDTAVFDRDAIADTRQRIGFVHQDCQFIDHLSIEENVALPLRVSAQKPAHQADDLRQLLAWVGLSDRAAALPPQLSGGERQRAALARAVVLAPEMILADEPTGNIDWEMSTRVLALLIELNRTGKTVLVATHDLHLIRQAKAQVQARVLRIRDGHLQLAGSDL